jgi:hypothetical protein
MQSNGEMNRINYANAKHHRELVRELIDPALIDRIEIAHNPSLNYKTAFKGVYQDELERTVEEHREKRMQRPPLDGNYGTFAVNRGSYHQGGPSPKCITEANLNTSSLSRIRRPFHDYEDEKQQKYDQLL